MEQMWLFNSETKFDRREWTGHFSLVFLRGNRQYIVSKIGYEDATGNVNVDSDKTVDVTLSRKLYTLSIEVTGNGTVTKNPDKPEYTHGEEVQLTALPDAGWSFTNWTGDLTGSDNPKVIVMDQNRSVTVNFATNTYTIVATAGPGGSIEPEGQIQVNHGDDKEFTITPATGYEIADVFRRWCLCRRNSELHIQQRSKRPYNRRFFQPARIYYNRFCQSHRRWHSIRRRCLQAR